MKNEDVVDDIQNPLPEANWKFRRIITYVLSIGLALGIGYMVYIIHDIADVAADKLGELSSGDLRDIVIRVFELMGDIVFWTYCFMFGLITYYLVAPSAEEVVKMFKIASLFRGKVADLPTPPDSDKERGCYRPREAEAEEDFAPKPRS